MKRYVVYGAGAIGGAIGARLAGAGADVTLIARGDHFAALAHGGLTIRTPDGEENVTIPVVAHPSDTFIGEGDVVILAMKTQDTAAALHELAAVSPSEVPVLCAQNGIENERLALRYYENVYGGYVFIVSAHLEPGVIAIHTAPSPGIVDIGRAPGGIDNVAVAISGDLRRAGFDSVVRGDIMAWKREKLLLNLTNAFQAITGAPLDALAELSGLARAEGEACLKAAGLPYVSLQEAAKRVAPLRPFREVRGEPFPGASSWQSLHRGLPSNEVEFLNGEIVLMGRLVGVTTPVNRFVHELVAVMVRRRLKPGFIGVDDLRERLRGLTAKTEDENHTLARN